MNLVIFDKMKRYAELFNTNVIIVRSLVR